MPGEEGRHRGCRMFPPECISSRDKTVTRIYSTKTELQELFPTTKDSVIFVSLKGEVYIWCNDFSHVLFFKDLEKRRRTSVGYQPQRIHFLALQLSTSGFTGTVTKIFSFHSIAEFSTQLNFVAQKFKTEGMQLILVTS